MTARDEQEILLDPISGHKKLGDVAPLTPEEPKSLIMIFISSKQVHAKESLVISRLL
jgi:hypothetical protein